MSSTCLYKVNVRDGQPSLADVHEGAPRRNQLNSCFVQGGRNVNEPVLVGHGQDGCLNSSHRETLPNELPASQGRASKNANLD